MGMLVQHVNRIANSPLIAEEVHRIQDEWGMAILKERFRQLLEEGHEESISAGGPDDGRIKTGEPRLLRASTS